MSKVFLRFVVWSLGLGLPPVALAQQPLAKLQVPAEADQKQAVALVSEIYKPDYLAARTADQKIALARKLLALGKDTKDDPVSRFVLFRIARDIATQHAELDLALESIRQMHNFYEVDPLAMQVETALGVINATKPGKDQLTIAAALTPLIDQAMAADEYEHARSLAALAEGCLREGGDHAGQQNLAAKIKDIEQLAVEFPKVKAALQVLESNPKDPAANLVIGRFLCLIKGDWQQGIKNLTVCDDESLRAAASLEREFNPDGVAVGDAWWKIAETLPGEMQTRTKYHAAEWYRKALPGLGGLTKARIQKQLESVNELPMLPPVVKQPDENDLAIKAGLDWLAKQQLKDGSWSFATGPLRGDLAQATKAATAMALLPFLYSGQTHQQGEYKRVVGNGLNYIVSNLKVAQTGADARETGASMYGQGLVTLALCEAYATTKDRKLQLPAQKAIDFIVYAQDPKGGGWRYQPQTPGDTSVTGWQLRALKTASDAGLNVPKQTLTMTSRFLDSVQANGGASYGYTGPGGGSATTAIGLLGRIYLGAKSDHAVVVQGVNNVMSQSTPSNTYFVYYAAALVQTANPQGADEWKRNLRNQLRTTQIQNGADAGSWPKDVSHMTPHGGSIGITSLTLLALIHANN